MKKSPQREAPDPVEQKDHRAAYSPPAIVYEGKITIRAGSPSGSEPFGGPPSPFSPPGS